MVELNKAAIKEELRKRRSEIRRDMINALITLCVIGATIRLCGISWLFILPGSWKIVAIGIFWWHYWLFSKRVWHNAELSGQPNAEILEAGWWERKLSWLSKRFSYACSLLPSGIRRVLAFLQNRTYAYAARPKN